MGIEFKIDGLEELQASIENVITQYPDAAGEFLTKQAREFRKEAVRKTRELTDTNSSSKRSLGKLGSYKISQISGYGTNQQVEIMAKSPHFHLVEHGHNLVTPSGKTIGFVQGRHQMETATKAFESKYPVEARRMIDGLMAKGGLS